MLGLKVSAMLASCIYMVAGGRPPSRHKALSSGPLVCPSGEWYWAPKHVCLPELEVAPGPDPHFPNGGICRPTWYWHENEYCAPLSSNHQKSCPRGYWANPSNFLCEPRMVLPPESVIDNQCPKGEWYWAPKHVCLPELEVAPGPDPHFPNGEICRKHWYWHVNGYCAPLSPSGRIHKCPVGYKVNPLNFLCEPNVVLPDNQCPKGEWYWAPKHVCLPELEVAPGPDPHFPNGEICRKHWYWHVNGYCAPLSPSGHIVKCPIHYKVNPSNFLCEPNVVSLTSYSLPQASVIDNRCPSGEWYWAPKHVCLPKIEDAPRPDPQFPNGGICRLGWYWHENEYCAPFSPIYSINRCPKDYKVNPSNFLCEPKVVLPQASVIENQCPKGEWYWSYKSICLPVGGPSDPLESPIGYICPPELYWHANGFCAPPTDQTKKGECPFGYVWKETEHYCELMGHGGSSN